MSTMQKTMLIGNLGADPDTRYMPSGGAVTNLSIATSERWKDKETGEQKERTEWHRVSMFGRLAEVSAEYLRKGSKVYIEGKLRTRKYTDKNQVERYSTEIIADQMTMLTPKSEQGGGQGRPPQGAPRSETDEEGRYPPPGQEFDDDIPF